MQNQFKENINLSTDVISYIANESKTNIRELIGVLNRVIAFSRVHNKVLNINDCKNILRDVFNQIKVITVDKIQNVVSNFFNITLTEMLSQRRSRPLARPRQIAMYLAKKMTTSHFWNREKICKQRSHYRHSCCKNYFKISWTRWWNEKEY